jgi:hypothetical protein
MVIEAKAPALSGMRHSADAAAERGRKTYAVRRMRAAAQAPTLRATWYLARGRCPCGGGGEQVVDKGGVMRRVVTAALIAAFVTAATVGAGAAQDRPEGGLNRERGITEARSHTGGPEASGKITFTDIIVSGRPEPGGGD